MCVAEVTLARKCVIVKLGRDGVVLGWVRVLQAPPTFDALETTRQTEEHMPTVRLQFEEINGSVIRIDPVDLDDPAQRPYRDAGGYPVHLFTVSGSTAISLQLPGD